MASQINSTDKSVFSSGMRLTDRRPATRREVDSGLDALQQRCARGQHPTGEGMRQIRDGVEFCCACDRQVQP